jgi:hypothetical protein
VVVVVGVATALAVAGLRQYRGVRISRARFRGLIVPTESFDPTAEEVLRFASMLAGTRTPVPLVTAARFRAVRVRLVSRGSDLAYCLEAPAWMAPTVRSARMKETELLPPEDLDEAEMSGPALVKPAAPTAVSAGGDGGDDLDPGPKPSRGRSGPAVLPVGRDGRDINELEADGDYDEQVAMP